MPTEVKKQGEKYRVVEERTGRLARNAQGTPVDGGGHRSRATAQRQANVINRNK